MKENFTLTIPKLELPRSFFKILISLLISFLIIYPLGVSTTTSVCSLILLTIFIYLIINNMNNDNRDDSLPFTTNPVPPHTGLDGIELDNLVAGVPLSKITSY